MYCKATQKCTLRRLEYTFRFSRTATLLVGGRERALPQQQKQSQHKINRRQQQQQHSPCHLSNTNKNQTIDALQRCQLVVELLKSFNVR